MAINRTGVSNSLALSFLSSFDIKGSLSVIFPTSMV